MANFDPSTISDIGASGPDITGSMAKGFQLKDMIDNNQLNQLKLNSEKQTAQDQQKFREVMSSGGDISTDAGLREKQEQLRKAGLVKESMDLGVQAEAVKSGQLNNQLKSLEVHAAAHDILTTSVGDIWQQANTMKMNHVPDAQINAWIQGKVISQVALWQNDQSEAGKALLNNIQPFLAQSGGKIDYDMLTNIYRNSKQGQATLKEMRDDLRAQVGVKQEQERERHDIRMEEIALRKAEDAEKAKGTADQVAARGNLLASLGVAGVNMPQRNKDALNQTLDGLHRKYPDKTDDEISQGAKSGTLSMAAEKTEASVLGRREAAILPVEKSITKPGGFLDQAEKAVNGVDFSKLKAAGRFESWSKDQLSDPALARYKAAVAELRAEYSIVLSKGGQVTDAARHESEKVIPDLITKDQFKAIKQTVLQGIESSKGGVEESISGVTGKPAPAATPAAAAQNDPLGIR